LSQKIASDLGTDIEYQTIVDQFNVFFLGPKNDGEGLIRREQWFPKAGLLERLKQKHELAIFTGRLRYEADFTLRRFAQNMEFHPIVCADDVVQGKPHPEGLEKIRREKPSHKLWYVGDTVDDARCSRAARVPFIGIAAATHAKRGELVDLLTAEGAVAVVENVNEIEDIL
jgi:phosphoglycolate phosphatase-like HAD superfamily hydrolase